MPKLGSVNQMLPSRAQTMSLGEFRRSEEHTSELQSQSNLVCRLLLEKKKPDSGTIDRTTELASSLAGVGQTAISRPRKSNAPFLPLPPTAPLPGVTPMQSNTYTILLI